MYSEGIMQVPISVSRYSNLDLMNEDLHTSYPCKLVPAILAQTPCSTLMLIEQYYGDHLPVSGRSDRRCQKLVR